MLIPIACRFVPYDQWFLTHLEDDFKVKQIKHWILSKCNLVQFPGPRTQRPLSPIIFAPSIGPRSSLDSFDDGYNEDDELSDQELPPPRHSTSPKDCSSCNAKPGSSSQSVQPRSSPLVDQYTLLSFSTSTVLEDEFTLSWYNFRPYELLEMHPAGIVVPLQRDVLAKYIQPYFQAKARVLRGVWNHKCGCFEPPGIDASPEHCGYKTKDKLTHNLNAFSPKSNALQPDKRRRTKADWKTRWVVINYGVLSLCKERATSPPLQQFALSNTMALCGVDALERAFSITTPRAVCIKFRLRTASMTHATSPPSSSPSSPISEDLKTNVQQSPPCVDSVSDLRRTTEEGHRSGRSGEYGYDPNDICREEGEWVILDMLDDHAFSSILRIFHRQGSRPMSSSFVPSPSIVTLTSHSTPPPVVPSFVSYDTIPYPEWRVNTVESARKAGMGDVGKPMAWVLWTEKGLGESLLGNIRHCRRAFSREMQYKTGINSVDMYESDDDSDDDSEMEWEGWMRDLERQSQVRERSEKARKSAVSRQASISSPLPSPPLSEASPPGSPRIGSTSLSHGAIGSYPYPNIGNVIQASGSHCSPEKVQSITFSTVSVGAAPSSRRRSSTLSSELATTMKHAKGRQVRPSIPIGGAHASVGTRWPANFPIRHAHSNSSLRMSLLQGSDESPVYARPSSPKRQSAFMRGMSLRAGRIVRGLESAIDFVDEKSV